MGTCGCASPLSGLAPRIGCLDKYCQDDRFTDILINASCQDLTPEELSQTPEWTRFWRSWAAGNSHWGDTNEFVVAGRADDASKFIDCSKFYDRADNEWVPERFCQSRQYTEERSIAAFCPMACECHNSSEQRWAKNFCPT